MSTPVTARTPLLSITPARVGLRLWNAGERIGAFVLLVVTLPLLVAALAIVGVLSGQWPLIRHMRIGRFGTSFRMLKLRTMWGDRVHEEPPEFTKGFEDPRVSHGFARFCRRYSIDELPQLVHVLSGRMALVGPRPLTRKELEHYYGESAAEILMVRPGLTGLWQVNGRSRLTYRQRRRLDLFLVQHPSVRLYVHILLRTVPEVICGRNSW